MEIIQNLTIDLWDQRLCERGQEYSMALAFAGLAPIWDNSARIVGFKILPLASWVGKIDITIRKGL